MCTAFLALFLSATLILQDSPAAGFRLAPLPNPGATAFSAVTALPGGNLVVFDGLTVDEYSAQGGFLRTLGSASSFVFPSFLAADPAGDFVLLGESSSGGIYRLSLAGPPDPTLVAVLPLNYDAVLRDSEVLYVSAATCGFGCGNEIWRVDLAARESTLVARVAGASGPLALDAAGNLAYATVSGAFPPPPGSSSVYRWSAQELASGTVLDETDATLLGTGFTAAARLAHDPERDELFLAEVDFATGANRIRRVRGTAAESPVLLEGRPFLSIGNLAFRGGDDRAVFLAHQPASGGTLTYTTTDFGTLLERNALEPLRPALAISGPGTTGPGNFDVALQDGPPGGYARVLACPRSAFHSRESLVRGFPELSPRPHLAFADLPLFFGLDQASTAVVPGLLRLDAQGRATQTYTNPGGMEGQFAFQLLLFDAERRVAGSSASAFL